MDLKPIIVQRWVSDYIEVVIWCKQTFSGGKNGRYDVVMYSDNDRVLVYLTPYTEEAATLITLKWL